MGLSCYDYSSPLPLNLFWGKGPGDEGEGSLSIQLAERVHLLLQAGI